MGYIAAPIVLGRLHVPGQLKIRPTRFSTGLVQSLRGRGRNVPLLRQRHVIKARGLGRFRHVGKANHDFPLPMDHVDMVVPAVPPLPAEIGTSLQREAHFRALPFAQEKLSLDTDIIEAAADCNRGFPGGHNFLESTARAESPGKARMLNDNLVCAGANGDRAGDDLSGLRVEDATNKESLFSIWDVEACSSPRQRVTAKKHTCARRNSRLLQKKPSR